MEVSQKDKVRFSIAFSEGFSMALFSKSIYNKKTFSLCSLQRLSHFNLKKKQSFLKMLTNLITALVLSIYCVPCSHERPFLNSLLTFSHSKFFKLACSLRLVERLVANLRIVQNLTKNVLFHSYHSHALPF